MTALHFEKSETLLVAFRNVRLNEPGTAAEVAYERKRAQQLVLQNMMLRREADASGDVQISSVLESLEPILIDISNLPDKPDKNAIRVIRERDRVNQPVNRRISRRRDFARQSPGRAFVFDVANENRLSREQRLQRFFARLRTHAVDHLRALLFERFRDVPRHALSIRDAKNDERFICDF